MPKHVVREIQEVTVKHTVTVTGAEIIAYLRASDRYVGPPPKFGPDAKVTVHVPGGGDWSNTDLDINEETTVNVMWTEKKVLINGEEQ